MPFIPTWLLNLGADVARLARGYGAYRIQAVASDRVVIRGRRITERLLASTAFDNARISSDRFVTAMERAISAALAGQHRASDRRSTSAETAPSGHASTPRGSDE